MHKKKLLTLILVFILFACASKPIASIKAEKPITIIENTVIVKNTFDEGKNLYQNNCGGCHRLYKANEFSKSEWQPILQRMQKEADLNDIDIASINDYIQSEI